MTDFRPPADGGIPANPPGSWVVPDQYPPPYPPQYPQQYAPEYYPPQQYQYYPPQQYQPPYPSPGYGPPAYGGYPAPGPSWPGGPPRPGPVMAASVLSYIAAGLLILAGLVLLAGASAVHDISNSLDSNNDSLTTEFVFDGISNLITAGLFIAGGTMFTGGNARGRIIIAVATAIMIAFSIYWMIRADVGFVIVWAVLFAALAVVATSLAFSRTVSSWLASRPPPALAPPRQY